MEEVTISVVIADPQPVARVGIREILQTAGISVIGETENGADALDLVRELVPDVLVCEMNLPVLSGLRIVVQLAEEDLPTRVLALSAYDDTRYIRHVMENGLAGYLRKHEAPARIVEAVRDVARSERVWLSSDIEQKMVALRQTPDAAERLTACGTTPREREVLRLLAKGFSNQEISERLYVSKNTVRTHVSRLYAKLGVQARREAIAWAWEHGLVES